MISLFFILFLSVTVFLIVKIAKSTNGRSAYEELNEFYSFLTFLTIIFGCVTIFFFIWCVRLIITVGTGHTLDKKINMYKAENATIEESIDATVKNYMSFEATTYAEFKDEDAINLISLFPELKSDTLVQQQIEVYVSNNQKIKELKEQQIDLSKAKFKLYFGQ